MPPLSYLILSYLAMNAFATKHAPKDMPAEQDMVLYWGYGNECSGARYLILSYLIFSYLDGVVLGVWK